MDTPRVYCKLYDSIEDSPARKLYMTAYHVLYSDDKITFDEFGEGTKFLCAFIEGKPVGIFAYVTEKGITYLNLVYVLTRYRKKGIMKKMFKYLFKEKDILVWRSRSDVTEIYESVGARRISKRGLSFHMTKEDFKK